MVRKHHPSDYNERVFIDSDSIGIIFTRLGWHNPQQQFPEVKSPKWAIVLKKRRSNVYGGATQIHL